MLKVKFTKVVVRAGRAAVIATLPSKHYGKITRPEQELKPTDRISTPRDKDVRFGKDRRKTAHAHDKPSKSSATISRAISARARSSRTRD